MASLETRFWTRVRKTETCWLWTGSIAPNGYGQIQVNRQSTGAHRIAYTLLVGPIPPGMQVCHRCDVRACVRPDHLFLGSQAANIADMIGKARGAMQKVTHCPKGHPYGGDNLYHGPRGDRRCRECSRDVMRRYRARKRSGSGAS